MSYLFSTEDLVKIRDYPHIIGHLVGYDKLTELHTKWILYIWDTNQEKSLQAHRKSYKTTSVIIIGTIWWLLFNHNDRIGIIRKSFTDASAVLFTVRSMMKKPIIRELFKSANGFYPEFRIEQNGKVVFNFKQTDTPEGNINAYGINQSLTGKHLDKAIFDDFVDLKDRLSETERDKTKGNVREVRTNIIDAGKSAAFVGTPWHKNDAWCILPKPLKYNVNQTDIMSDEIIKDTKEKTTPALYAINYLLQHTAEEGLLFANPQYRTKWIPLSVGVSGHLDAAYGGQDSNALTFMAEFRNRPGIIQAVGKHFGGHVDDWYDVIEAEYRKRKCGELFLETNADKGYVAKELKKRGLNIKEYSENQNKHIKISSYLYNRWKNIEWVDSETDGEYLEQIMDYQKGNDWDHAPDSASSLIREKFYGGNQDYKSLYDM